MHARRLLTHLGAYCEGANERVRMTIVHVLEGRRGRAEEQLQHHRRYRPVADWTNRAGATGNRPASKSQERQLFRGTTRDNDYDEIQHGNACATHVGGGRRTSSKAANQKAEFEHVVQLGVQRRCGAKRGFQHHWQGFAANGVALAQVLSADA